jgi:hypothetical protein
MNVPVSPTGAPARLESARRAKHSLMSNVFTATRSPAPPLHLACNRKYRRICIALLIDTRWAGQEENHFGGVKWIKKIGLAVAQR